MQPQNLIDIETFARERLSKVVYDYYRSGAWDESTLRRNREAFGEIEFDKTPRCFEVSHGYSKPCDQSGEDCPLGAAVASGHKERVLHIHQTPRGREHVDVEMLPIHNAEGDLAYFVELLRPVPLASGEVSTQELVGSSPPFEKMLENMSGNSKI